MIDETFQRIEARIRTSDGISDSSREELIELLGSLKTEVSELAAKDPDQAKGVAEFAAQSIRASQAARSPGFESSVEEFETKHPQLVERVNRLCVILSNMGI